MARKLILPALVLISLLICSCRRYGSVDHNSLIGDWQWVMQTDATAINGVPYDTLTPTSIGIRTRDLFLMNDSSYVMTTFTVAAPSQPQTETGKFRIIQLLTPGGPVKVLDFIHNGVDSTVNHTLNNDKLYISNTLYTGKYSINVYSRIIPI